MTGGGGVAPPAPQGVIERTDNIKTALTQLAQQVSSSGQGIKSLTWRMNSGDGNAEWTFEFNGTPEEATYLRSFIEGQWRRGGEKVLDITYQLHYDPPLSWDDAGEGWIGRLTRAGLGTQSATIRLELTAVAGGQP